MNPLLKLAGTIIDKVIFAYCVYKSKIINKLMGGGEKIYWLPVQYMRCREYHCRRADEHRT